VNPIRQWIDDLLACAKKKAAIIQMKRELDEHLYLFAIEIGRGKKLMPDERRVYAKTFRTAQVMLSLKEEMANSPPKLKPIKNIMKEPAEEWLLKEPVVKAELESRLKHRLSDLEDAVLPPEDRAAIIRYLNMVAAACPSVLSIQELESIVDRLDHPLDRA
jgi:hypothetical protein